MYLKNLHTYGSWDFFFSAAPTAQNNPELNFRFIISDYTSWYYQCLIMIKKTRTIMLATSQVKKRKQPKV